MSLTETTTLANGVEMPRFGLGVWQAEDGEEVTNAVKWALDAGYRAIDTAAAYQNEEGVGEAIRQSGLDRKELFITTKVANSDQGYDETLAAFDKSLERLGTDYIDLYLIHWPIASSFVDTWKALEKIYTDGRAKSIGVCNFHPHHFDTLLKSAEIVPMVNQIELHPLLSQEEVRDYCATKNIAIEAYSPLGSGGLLQNKQLEAIAEKYGKSVAQVLLRWDWQLGIITIPKSVHQDRIKENANIFDFALADKDMATIDAMNKNERFGWNPNRFDNK